MIIKKIILWYTLLMFAILISYILFCMNCEKIHIINQNKYSTNNNIISNKKYINYYERINLYNPLNYHIFHGNYCGPKKSGPGISVDKIDSICKKHDECYSKKGYFNCNCDYEFKNDIDILIKNDWNKLNIKQKIYLDSIEVYFSSNNPIYFCVV
ncbi:hypothetical protein [Peptoanaerobacter stomatis]|uniref:hypothetical protein n=1 Tax=Peptoanaerobacter stomatis TaxID=796937 RepID=UPI003FA02F1A